MKLKKRKGSKTNEIFSYEDVPQSGFDNGQWPRHFWFDLGAAGTALITAAIRRVWTATTDLNKKISRK